MEDFQHKKKTIAHGGAKVSLLAAAPVPLKEKVTPKT